MLFTTASHAEKRKAFRDGLASGTLQKFPGAFSPLVAMAIENAGYDGIYLSGAVLSADLGLPDIGLTSLTEVAQRGQQIARVTNLPALIDCDTGFGEPMSAARTVQMMEDMGICGLHLEDQVNPKRCGHLDNKDVVDVSVAAQRIRAAVDGRRDDAFLIMARSDARAIEGLDKAIDRMKAYVDAGADAIFPEAMWSPEDFEAVRKAIDVPILANMTEFGKSELLNDQQLQDLGVNMVIYPVTTLRIAMGAVERGLKQIQEDGHQNNLLDQMQHRRDLYALLRYEDYNHFDQDLYNFKV